MMSWQAKRKQISVSGLQSKDQAGFGHTAFYAQKNIDTAYMLGLAGWSFGKTTTTRNVLPSLHSRSFKGQDPNARIEAGYRFSWNTFALIPYAALQGIWLYVDGQTSISLPGSIDLQVKDSFRLNQDWGLNLRGRAAYVHEFYPSRTITAQFVGIPQAFNAVGRPMPSNGFDIGAGVKWLNKGDFSLTLANDALLASGAIGWRWQAAASYQW